MRKPFKLRSGNTTPFKQIGSSPVKRNGENEETMEQYNTRVLADYKSKLQAHSDSTAAHTNRLRSEQLVSEINELEKKRKREITVYDNFDDSGDDKNRMLSADEQLAMGHTHDTKGAKIIAGSDKEYYDIKNRLTKEQIAENKKIEKKNKPIIAEQRKKARENMKLRRGNIKAGIYEKTSGGEYKGSLKPGPPPAKPNVGKLHHSKYYDAKTEEYRVTSYNPKKLKSGKYSSTGRGKKISDMSLAEWKRKYNKN